MGFSDDVVGAVADLGGVSEVSTETPELTSHVHAQLCAADLLSISCSGGSRPFLLKLLINNSLPAIYVALTRALFAPCLRTISLGKHAHAYRWISGSHVTSRSRDYN